MPAASRAASHVVSVAIVSPSSQSGSSTSAIRSDVLGRVDEPELLLGRAAPFAPHELVLEEDGQPLRPLGVVAGRVEARERGMRQDVDRTISASASRSPSARPSR